MKCPNCKLENPPGAARCDCGHAFVTMEGQLRTCPFCAEKIQAAAVKCRFCGESLVTQRGTRKSSAAVTVVLVMIAAGLVYIGTSGMHIFQTPVALMPDQARQAPRSEVTLMAYSQIQKGMSYEKVCEIIGTAGQEISRSNVATYETVMYAWKNHNGSNMNAMFQNGALVTKAQFGLR